MVIDIRRRNLPAPSNSVWWVAHGRVEDAVAVCPRTHQQSGGVDHKGIVAAWMTRSPICRYTVPARAQSRFPAGKPR
jgi:hypothetical protein